LFPRMIDSHFSPAQRRRNSVGTAAFLARVSADVTYCRVTCGLQCVADCGPKVFTAALKIHVAILQDENSMSLETLIRTYTVS
jgi:hypothetical protein